MKYLQVLSLSWFLTAAISAMTISPHGGYLSVEEGADFYVECIGAHPQWIIVNRSASDTARISTHLIEHNRKSVLTIQGMDASLAGPYLCQANGTVSTIILQLTKRKSDMTKQIRFMSTSTNQSVVRGDNVRLNCYAQYYSEKAMDSPYLPKILWFFERRQISNGGDKYVLGTDSIVIRNFAYYDQGVYYCRAFITLKNNFLSRIYPINVQLQDAPSFVNETVPSRTENKSCGGFAESVAVNNTVSYCNVDGYVSNYTCPADQIWDDDYAQCTSPLNRNPILQILPQLSHINVELGRTYTLLCRSSDQHIHPEWTYANGTSISADASPDHQITSYALSDTHTVYLRLSPVTIGTYTCRARSTSGSSNRTEVTVATTSITLTAQMIAETTGISFQSSTLAEYHVRANSTLFLACRPEYFDFQAKSNISHIPTAHLIRLNDNLHFQLSETLDGILINGVGKNESGMYVCRGQVPLPTRVLSSVYPVMVVISEP